MFSFDNLHRNKKLAFVDGLLCGVGIALFGYVIYKDWREERDFQARVKEAEEAAQNSTES